MSNFVKNPFGMRNGKLITISDLSDNERGAQCNCVCPDCEGKFLARIGSIRTPHFAHEKDSMCDPEKAFKESLYMFLREAISDTNSFNYPGLYGFCTVFDVWKTATRKDIESIVVYSDIAMPPECDYEEIIAAKTVSIVSAEIQRDSKKLPQALLIKHIDAKGAEHLLAIQIVLPPNVCKTFEAKQYKKYPTLAINIEEDLYHIGSDSLKIKLRDSIDSKDWIYSPAVEKWLDRHLKKQHEAHRRYAEKIYAEQQEMNQRRTECDQKRKQERKNEQNRNALLKQKKKQMWDKCKEKVEQCGISPEIQNSELSDYEKIFSQYLSMKYPTPPNDKHVRDPNGTRWALCDDCNMWCPDSKMAEYGGLKERMNRGVCSWCNRKRTQLK